MEKPSPTTIKSPLKTIREHCLDCSGTSAEVRLCTVTICKLWPYRFGHSINRAKKTLTEDQLEKLRKRFSKKTSPESTGVQNPKKEDSFGSDHSE